MHYVAFDTETAPPTSGYPVGKGVCFSWANEHGESGLLHFQYDRHRIEKEFRHWLTDDDLTIVNHNIWYDLGVIVKEFPNLFELVWKKVDKGLIACTAIRQQLIQVGEGRYDWDPIYYRKPNFSLAEIAHEYLGLDLSNEKKNPDAWRMRYMELYDVPLEDWPEAASSYAIADAIIALKCYFAQDNPLNEEQQQKYAWPLYLSTVWGMRTDAKSVADLKARLRAEMDEVAGDLVEAGIYRVNKKNAVGFSQDQKATRQRVIAAYNGDPPLTKTGIKKQEAGEEVDLLKYTSIAGDTLDQCRGDEVLKALSGIMATRSELNNFIPLLERGTTGPINPRIDYIKKTGRTSYRKPNLQNLPRRKGVRECFTPRPGFAYVTVDYDALEIRTWAQACLDIVGWSTAAQKFIEDPHWDPHTNFAAEMMGISYEEAMTRKRRSDKEVKGMRQLAKVPNFGKPGGMGNATLIDYAWKNYRLELSEEKAEELGEFWKQLYPEHRPYFNHVSQVVNTDKVAILPRSNRIRGDVGFCDCANYYFQGAASDGAKNAMYLLSKECYLDTESPLYGSRPVVFVHDEVIAEVPLDMVQWAGPRMAEIMIEGMKKYVPDVPITAEPAAMMRWYKDAEPVYNKAGGLEIWHPK